MAACPGNIKRTEYGQLHIFRTGPLGQHFTCKLTVDSVNYQSSLQYMYHQKALLFQDNEIAAKVMKCTDQHYDKFFEKVKNREKLNLWESRCADIIHKGNQEKFDQNVGLRQSLLETAGKLLVYADAKDCLLGIGIDDRNDGKAYDKKQWRGKNELGNVLTNIRDDILSAYQWCENDKCMARWSKNKKFYDATIVWIHPQRTTCKVQFDEYKDCEECDPICLIPRKDRRQFASHGKQGRRPTDEDWDKEVDLAERSSDGSEQRKKFTFFWQGYDKLSQWYGCKFKVDGIAYNCAEQFMMHQKALHFKDNKTAEEILKTKLPKHQKDLGRTVRGYDEASWDSVCEDIVIRGNMAKFSQNSDLRTHLLSTAGTILAEASPYDCKWGIGLTADDPRAADERKWRGTNLLGKCLMVVREELMKKGADFHDDAVHEDCESDPEEGYTMFWHQPSPFSQWHPASFHIGGITYNCAEQYMMHQKAVYFGDSECAFRILMEREPRRQKQLARGVRRFNETEWNAVSRQFVKEGSIGKYSQNPHLRRELFATANTELVEASADDFRWGIGWTKDDRLSWTRRTWRGENWLGLILTEVRDELIKKTWPESDEDYREPRYGEAQSWRAFSKPGSPFHLFHPAEIDYDGNKYKSAGHCLLNKLSKSAGNESIAKLVTELNKPEQLMNLLSELMKGLDQWSDDLNNVLESVNKAKFQQHQNLREKLLDTYTDMLVYAGGERHLGIDYSLGVRGYTERENKLGQVLMKLRNEYLPPQTPASQRASKRPRDSSGDWRSKDASDRSFNERHNSKTPRRDDNVWGSSSRRDISNKRGTGSSHSSRDDRSSRIQRGSRDDGRSSRNSSSERYDINELYADSTDRKNICETPKSSTIADRSHSDNSFKDERIEMSSSSLSRQHRDFDDSCSRKEEADEMKSGKKDKRHSALNAMQQCIDVFFSDNTNPFHLWYPAPVQVAGKQYTCVGQLLLHKAATEVLKDNQLARRIIDNGGDENLQQEVKEACDKENGHGWQDLITGCLPELHQLKFSQHRDLAEILLKTGNTNLLYVAPDNRLGTGGMNAYGKFSGRNFLGKTLVKFRSTFDPSAHCDELGSPEVAAAATASSCPESATSPSATSCSGLTRADAEGVGHKKPKKGETLDTVNRVVDGAADVYKNTNQEGTKLDVRERQTTGIGEAAVKEDTCREGETERGPENSMVSVVIKAERKGEGKKGKKSKSRKQSRETEQPSPFKKEVRVLPSVADYSKSSDDNRAETLARSKGRNDAQKPISTSANSAATATDLNVMAIEKDSIGGNELPSSDKDRVESVESELDQTGSCAAATVDVAVDVVQTERGEDNNTILCGDSDEPSKESELAVNHIANNAPPECQSSENSLNCVVVEEQRKDSVENVAELPIDVDVVSSSEQPEELAVGSVSLIEKSEELESEMQSLSLSDRTTVNNLDCADKREEGICC